MLKFLSTLFTLIALSSLTIRAETIVIMGSDTIGAKAALHLAEAFNTKTESIDRDYGENTQKVAGNEQIASEVARNVNAIGYVGLAYADTPGVKVVPVEGMLPRAENYPLNRTLFYLVDANIRLSQIANDFIGFTLSPQGQHIIEGVPFVPIY